MHTPEEREVIVTFNDADRSWHVFSDSTTMRGTVLKLARQVGADVKQTGQGIEFDCPGDALRLTARRRVKLSEAQRDALETARAARRSAPGRAAGDRMGLPAGGTE